MRKILLLSFFSIFALISFAQDFSNKGKDFWVAYGYHQVMNAGNGQQMVLYFATDQVTNITITVPGTGYTQNLTSGATPTVLTSAPLPRIPGPQDTRLTSESIAPENKGIHVVSDKPIVAYAHIYNSNVSGASILFPTNTLGREYYSINYTNNSNSANSNCWMYVIAADTGTTIVEITPSVATINHAAGVPFQVTLTQGQVYNVMATYGVNSGGDLTGSVIKSISVGSVGCKRIAVFSGSGRIAITCNGSTPSSDNYMVQAFPKNAWGKKYLTASTSGTQSNNIYRICVADPTTIVTRNGGPVGLPLINNFYYEIPATNIPQKIESDKPILVSQYTTCQGACGNGAPGDPEVIYLSPVEQNISKVLWNATPNFNITEHHFNVIIPNTGTAISSFRLDGNPVSPFNFVVHPQDPNYSYFTLPVSSGSHSIQSDSGFNAIAYGFGNFESYGYNAGTNVKDLYQRIGVSSQFGTEATPSVCAGSPFKFKVSLPYQPDSMYWNFYNPATVPAISNVNVLGPIAFDSVVVINGKTVWWYSLPGMYIWNTLGIFPITITTYSQNTEGCGNVQEIDFDLEVTGPPVAAIASASSICDGQALQFNDVTVSPKPTYSWWWNFDDPASGANNISTLKNPTHLFSGPGTYFVRFTNINTAGCFSDTTDKQIVINPLPTASLSGAAIVCVNGASPSVTFTGTGSSFPYTFTYKLNGGPNQTIATTGTNTSVSFPVPTTTAGTFIYTLVSVSDGATPACSQAQPDTIVVVVNPLPGASLTGTTTVCRNAVSPTVTFIGSNGAAPYTFTYNINGGPNLTTTTVTGNSISLPVPTNTSGTFIYTVTSVQGGSSLLCSQIINATATVVINDLPTASVSGTTQVCLNGASPSVTFTGSGTTTPYTFIYKINGGANQTAVTTGTNTSVSIPVPTNIAGTFAYTLVTVSDGSSSSCSQAQPDTVIITVNRTPTAAISGATIVCQNAAAPNIVLTGSNGTAPYTFSYNINGGATSTISTITGNSVSIPVPTNIPGIFNYTITDFQGGSSAACTQITTGTASVIVNALPTASLSGTTEVCLNAPAPTITFTGAGTTAPYTFTYKINAGPDLITTSTGNTATLTVPTNVAGTFNYSLVSVRDATANLCSQLQTSSAVVTVNPLPVANFTPGLVSCENKAVSFTDGSVPNAGTVNEWNWNFGDPASGAANLSNAPNPSHLFSGATTYPVSLFVKTTKGCISSVTTTNVVVNRKPEAGFINPEVCLTDTWAQFTDTSTLSGVPLAAGSSWLWNFDDPASGALNTSTLQNPQHSYTTTGPKNVTLYATSVNSCVDTLIQTFIINGDIPVAGYNFSNAGAICAYDSVATINTSSVNVGSVTKIEIYWDNVNAPGVFDTDDNPLPNKVYKHLYPLSTVTRNYSVKYRAFSGTSCFDDEIKTITVQGVPAVQFNPIPNTCLDVPAFQITQASETGGVIAGPAPVFSGPGVSPSGIFNPATVGPGLYTINYLFTSNMGCIDTASQQIRVLQPPVAMFRTVGAACEDQALSFEDQSSPAAGTLVSWAWDFDDLTPIEIRTSAAPFNHTFQNPGTYDVILTVTTSDGCVKSKTIQVIVNSKPIPNFAFPPISCLPNALVSFENLSTPGTYNWNFGDPASGVLNTNTGFQPSHIYTGLGPYAVTLEVRDAGGCIQDTVINVNTIHPQPKANFQATTPSVCFEQTASFQNLSDPADGSFDTWHWDFGDGTGSSIKDPTHTYLRADSFTVSLYFINSFGCVSDTVRKGFNVYPKPIVSAGPDIFVLEDGSSVINPIVTGNDLTYLWTPDLYLSNNTSSNPITTPKQDLYYTLIVTSRGGCIDSSRVFVKVLLGPKIPNTFTPNQDNFNDEWTIEYLDTYPNNRVQVFTRTGQLVFESRGYKKKWDGTLKGQSLPMDTYYYIIEPGNGRKPLTGYVTILK